MKTKFAHLADCHLGGWRYEELRDLNFKSFQKTIQTCIEENVEFILISGDLFDSAYPSIDILKETFAEFRKIKQANIPVYIIAGSHDFSTSGKTFLDVLEKAGFCKNVEDITVEEDKIKLKPHLYKDIAIFGYSGRKSGMEIEELRKVEFDSIYPFTIFMIHTTISDVVGTIPMDSIDKLKLPLADYYAMGHIHQVFEKKEQGSTYIYPGPVFPNNFQELSDLKYGSFQITEIEDNKIKTKNIKIPLKEIVNIEVEISDGLIATEKIIKQLDLHNLEDKIVLLKLIGTLEKGKTGDIRFDEIEDFAKKKNSYVFLRHISSLKVRESEIEIDIDETENVENKIIEEYIQQNPSDFNKVIPQLIEALSIEKQEDEKINVFEERLMGEVKKILSLE